MNPGLESAGHGSADFEKGGCSCRGGSHVRGASRTSAEPCAIFEVHDDQVMAEKAIESMARFGAGEL
jgi:hypothetical protein